MLKGFTLIELLVVITIIALLIGIGTYSWDKARQKARDNRRKQDIHAIKGALALYYEENGEYPPVVLRPVVPSCNGKSGAIADGSPGTEFNSDCADVWIPDLADKYIQKLPKDPLQGSDLGLIYCGSKIYCYEVSDDRKKYFLWAILENKNDPEIYNRPARKCPSATTPPALNFNYCVQNDF